MPDWAVEDGVSLFEVVEQEGGVEDAEILVHPGEEPGPHHRHLDRAALHGGRDDHLTAERSAGVDPDLELAAALLAHDVGKSLGAHAMGRLRRVGERQLDRALLDLLGGCEAGRQDGGCQQGRSQDRSEVGVHLCLLWLWL